MISLSELSFSYEKKKVLNRLTLDLNQGSIYGLLGRNGAGKSTLLKLLSGELFHKSGSLSVLNHTPSDRHPSFLCDVFYIPEEFSLPSMKIDTYLELQSPFYPKFDKNLFVKFLEEFELQDEKRLLTKLSYGQKKKFLLAFALAAGTSLLLLDEPTNGLDIPSKTQFRRTVASALRDDQIILISTHQVRDMENLIDPLIILDRGELKMNASLVEISEKYIIELLPKGSTVNALYREAVPGGEAVVRSKSANDEETAVDLEILFNFITSGKEEIHE